MTIERKVLKVDKQRIKSEFEHLQTRVFVDFQFLLNIGIRTGTEKEQKRKWRQKSTENNIRNETERKMNKNRGTGKIFKNKLKMKQKRTKPWNIFKKNNNKNGTVMKKEK